MSTQQVKEALSALRQFLTAVREKTDLSVDGPVEVEAVTDGQLGELAEASGRPLDEDLRAFLGAGFPTRCYIEGDAEFHFAHLEFMPLAEIAGTLEWWGQDWQAEEEAFEDDDSDGVRLRIEQLHYGLPLWETENTIVVDGRTGAVGRISGEPGPSDAIAASLGEFLIHFVAAGCFHYGGADRAHFEAYWKQIADVVPFGIAPRDNLWLQHLDRWYDGGNITKAD